MSNVLAVSSLFKIVKQIVFWSNGQVINSCTTCQAEFYISGSWGLICTVMKR